MPEIDPDADDPHEILGTSADATETEVKVAAAKAKRELNPDHFPDGAKREARRKLYVVKEAEQAILEDREMDPTVGERRGESAEEASSSSSRRSADRSRGSSSRNRRRRAGGRPPGGRSTPERVELSISAETDRPAAGEPVAFRVTDEGGDPVVGARVSARGGADTARTDRRGHAELVFESSGSRAVRVTADEKTHTAADDAERDGSTRRYSDAETTVVVSPQTVALSLDADATSVRAEEVVTFQVLDGDRDPVPDATITVSGTTLTTNANGIASTALHDPGTVRARANKDEPDVRYRADAVTVEVTAAQAPSLSLTVQGRSLDSDGTLRIDADETVEFRVTELDGRGSAEGNAVAGATLLVEYADGDVQRVTTDAGGSVAIAFEQPGRATVTARSETVTARSETGGGRSASDDSRKSEPVVVLVRARHGDGDDEASPNVSASEAVGESSEVGFDGRRLAARAIGIVVLLTLGVVTGAVYLGVAPLVPLGVGAAVIVVGTLAYLRLVV
jgi:hypothetical protein